MMRIVLRDIPSSALFYSEKDGSYTVFLEMENGCVKDPITCLRQNSNGDKEFMEKYYEDMLPYIDDVVIKRLLIESMIIDTKIAIEHYIDAINDATPEELNRKIGEIDPTKWWTSLYPTRLELYTEHISNEKKALKKYKEMLNKLKGKEESVDNNNFKFS